MSKERAQAKIDEWFVGVTEQAFRAAVELKLAVGVAEGDYRFKGADDRLQVAEGALRFFREFSSKVIELKAKQQILRQGRLRRWLRRWRNTKRQASHRQPMTVV